MKFSVVKCGVLPPQTLPSKVRGAKQRVSQAMWQPQQGFKHPVVAAHLGSEGFEFRIYMSLWLYLSGCFGSGFTFRASGCENQ